MTTTTIQKWGNSQGIRLPKFLLEALSWRENEAITIETIDNKIVIEKLVTPQKQTLAQLFADFDGTYTPEDIQWGEPVGEEIW